MKRSNRNPSRNVLKRFYAFALGAAISTVAISAHRTTTPGVQESNTEINATNPVRIVEMKESLLSSEPCYLEICSVFDNEEPMVGDVFRKTESQEQDTNKEFMTENFAQINMSEIVEGGYIAVKVSVDEKLQSFEEDEMENVDVPAIVVASAAPRTDVHRVENVTKAVMVDVETSAVEAITSEVITENIVDENIIANGIPNIPNTTYGNWGPDSPLFSPSGLTAEQIGKVLAGTDMEGLENVVYATEQKYGINACILLAIACNESGYGTSRMAKNQNNLFGMMGMRFDSLEENIDYFGQLMVKYRDEWNKTMTANGIARSYVGQNENTAGWPKKITGIMNQIYSKAIN